MHVLIACMCLYTSSPHLQLGRKPLLLLGTLGMFGSITLAGTLLLVFRVESGGSRAVGYVVMAALCFFVFSFATTIA